MKLNPNIFRMYDIRGVADVDLSDPVVEIVGRAIGRYYLDRGANDVVIGRDMRTSSVRIAKNLISALLNSGLNVIDIGMVPTPVLYFSLFYYNKPCGIMITGSHNPKEFNGLKICYNKSSIFGDEIQHIKAIAQAEDFSQGNGQRSEIDPVATYIDEVLKRVSIKRTPHLIIDSGNGMVGPTIARILRNLDISYEIMNEKPDGNFPSHLPDPTVIKYIEDLINRVKEKEGIGIGFDGDGDRIGVVDEEGKIIWGDHLLGIYSKPVIKENPGSKIIFDVKCSRGLSEYIESLGGRPIMYKTGHSLIKAKMKEEKALLAGEMSGHMFFADNYHGFDDSIFAALRLLEVLSLENRPLRELDQEFPYYLSTPEIRIDCSDEKKFDIVEKAKEEFSKTHKVVTIDGVRIEYPDGWGLIRPSNTQPILVLRFEAKDKRRLNEIRQEILDYLKKFPPVKF